MWRHPIVNGEDDLLEEFINPKMAKRVPNSQEQFAQFPPQDAANINQAQQRSLDAQKKYKEFLQLPELKNKNLSTQDKAILAMDAPYEHLFDEYKKHGIDLTPHRGKSFRNDALIDQVLRLEAVARSTDGIMDPKYYPDIGDLRKNVEARNLRILQKNQAGGGQQVENKANIDPSKAWRDNGIRLAKESFYDSSYGDGVLRERYSNPVSFKREYLTPEEQEIYDRSPELIRKHMRQGVPYDVAHERAFKDIFSKVGDAAISMDMLSKMMMKSEDEFFKDKSRKDMRSYQDSMASIEKMKTMEELLRKRYEQSTPKRIQDLAIALGLQGQDPDTVERTMDAVNRALRSVRDDASVDMQRYGDPVAEIARLSGLSPNMPKPSMPAQGLDPTQPAVAPAKSPAADMDNFDGNKNIGGMLKQLMGANAYASLSAKAKEKDVRSDEILHEIYSSLGEQKFIDNLPIVYQYMKHIATPGKDRWKEALNVSSNDQFGYNASRLFGGDASANDTVIKLRNYLGLGMPSQYGAVPNILTGGGPVLVSPIKQMINSLYDPRLENYSTAGRIMAGLYNSTRGDAVRAYGPQASDELKLKLVGDLLPWEEKMAIANRMKNKK